MHSIAAIDSLDVDVLRGRVVLKKAASDYNHAMTLVHDLEHFLGVVWDWRVSDDQNDVKRWPLTVLYENGVLTPIFNWMDTEKTFEKVSWDDFIKEVWDHKYVDSVTLALYHSTAALVKLEEYPVKGDDQEEIAMDCPKCYDTYGAVLELMQFHKDMGKGYYLCHKCGFKYFSVGASRLS